MTPSPERPWCAQASRDRDEPLAATASRVERWLLVEHDTMSATVAVFSIEDVTSTSTVDATLARIASADFWMRANPAETSAWKRAPASVSATLRWLR